MASQAVTTREENSNDPVKVLRGTLTRMESEFKMVLPGHISPEKFQRTIMTAVQTDAKLLSADRTTLFRACMKAAQDGLLPDGREAALVIFNTKIGDRWVDAVQYMPMVYGLRKKILQSGEISSFTTQVVYRAELESGAFVYEQGTEAELRHKPSLTLTAEETADSEIVAAYSIAVMKDGSKSFEVMRRSEIDKVREVSKTGATRDKTGKARSPSGPWVDWFSEQCRKTVARRHSKSLPMTSDIIDVEAREDIDHARSAALLLASPQADAPTSPRSRLDQLEEAIAGGEEVDAGSGEVTTGLERRDGQPGYDLNAAGAESLLGKLLAELQAIELVLDLDEFENQLPEALDDAERTTIDAAIDAKRRALRGPRRA